MSTMMADVINAGTGSRARQLGFKLPAAGKTGTTNDFKDAWFIGFTPKLAAGVWVGFDEPRTILPNGFAADVAVPAWAKFMKAATRDDKPEWLVPPPGVTTASVCRMSGQLASDGCHDVEVVNRDGTPDHRSMVYTEYFARGTEPTTYCELHPTRTIVTQVAGFLAGQEKPAPARADDPAVVQPQAATAISGTIPVQIENPPQPPRKRRGFWSRVFGVGKDDNPDDKDQAGEQPPKKKSGG
jgi:membrane peptidoglycan carboxypeptidase